MSRLEKWLAGFALLVVLLHLAGTFLPGPHTWGFNHYAFLPKALIAILGVLTLLLFLPPVTRAAARALYPAARGLGSSGGARIAAGAATGLLVVCFLLGRERTFLLSDGMLLLRSVSQGFVSFTADTLAAVIQLHAHAFLADVFKVTSASASFRVVALLSGVTWLAAVFATTGRLTKSGWGRLLLGVLLATAGFTKFFYGYVETGPLLAAAIGVYLWTGVRLVQDGRGIIPATAAFLVAAGMHVTGLLLLPSFVFLVHRWAGRDLRRLGLAAVLLLLPFAGYLGYWFSRGGTLPVMAEAYRHYFTEFIPLTGPLNVKQAFTFFSLPHLFEFLNEQLLLGPFALLALGVVLLARVRRSAAGAETAPARADAAGAEAPAAGASIAAGPARFFWFVLVPFLLLALTFHRGLGGGRDWDLLANLAVPAIFLVGLSLLEGGGGSRRREGSETSPARGPAGGHRPGPGAAAAVSPTLPGLVILLAAASLLHLAGWILVDTSVERSLARFQSLFADGAPVSRFARSYALEELGLFQLDRGRREEALAAYEAAVRINPDNVHALGTLGTWYSAAGRHDEALPLLQRAAQLRADVAMNHYNLGAEWMARGRWDSAASSFQWALRLNPDFLQAQVGLAGAYSRLNRLAEAEQLARDGLKTWPQNIDFRTIIGSVQELAGRPAAAITTYQEALAIDPVNRNALFNAGRLLVNSGQFAEAIPYLEKLVQLDPGDAEAATNLGVACENAGRRSDAMKAFVQAIAADPAVPQPYMNLATILYGQGRLEEARGVLESLMEKNPKAGRELGVPVLIERMKAARAGQAAP